MDRKDRITMNFSYETDHLLLRVEHQTAAPKVLDFYKRNRPYFDAWEITRPHNFYSTAFQSASLAYEYHEILENHALRFWIYDKYAYFENAATATIIGSLSLSHLLRGAFQTAMFGYKLDHDYWSKGYAFEACSAFIKIAFSEYHLHRLEAYIMPANERSIRLIKRLGFSYEGCKKSFANINHRYEDHLQFALLDGDHI